MQDHDYHLIFNDDVLLEVFPEDRSDKFFEALYADVDEGAYDINLHFKKKADNKLYFEFHLNQRLDKCLVCSLTYGLPNVFLRHPVIGLKDLSKKIETFLPEKIKCVDYELGNTKQVSNQLHIIQFVITCT